MEYRIRITETASRVVTVDAEDEQSAVDIVSDQYYEGEIVLDYDDFDYTDIKALYYPYRTNTN
jgi:hypothetical protein